MDFDINYGPPAELELPTVKKIEREAFSVEDFEVDKFLYDYHQFQTLEDLQKQLRYWKQVVEQELIDVINNDYKEFVGLGKSLSGGEARIQDVKMEVLSFERQATRVQSALDTHSRDLGHLLEQKRELVRVQNRVKKLIMFSQQLTDLETRLTSGTEEIDNEDLVAMSKTLLSLRKVHQKTVQEPFVQRQRQRLDAVAQDVRAVLSARLKHVAGTSTASDIALQMVVVLQHLSPST